MLSVAALASATVMGTVALSVGPVAAATTIDAIVPTEVDALNRTVLDVSADGLWVLTTENGDGRPEKRINLATGAVDVLPSGMGNNTHLSADGSLIVLSTFEAFVGGDTNSDLDVYTYHVPSATFTLVPLTNAPADWTFSLQDISGDARYLGMYGTNGIVADSGSFIFDRQTSTWAQPDSLLPDFQEGPQRQSSMIRISSDGRYAAWVTFPLAGGFSEVWVYNIAAGTAVRVSQRFDNAALTNGSSGDPEISPDGRHVVFRSAASHVVSGVTTTGNRVYVRHLDTAQTVLVTAAETDMAPYSGPSIGGGTQVFVMEAVASTVNGSPEAAPQPVLYDLAADTRMVLTDPVGSAVPSGYTLYGFISANGARAVYAGTVDNAGVVTPTDPAGQLSMRVLQTSLKAPLPARLLDTRPTGRTDDGQFQAGGVRAADSTLVLDVAGRQTIPADAEAVVLNITAVAPAGGGWVTAYPCDATPPNASSLNVTAGRTIANMAISKLAADGTVCLYTSVGTHLLVDALSFFPSGSQLVPVVPQRMLDTRPTGATIDDLFEQAGPVAANGTVTLDLADRGDIPADAVAVVMNITATGHGTGGFLRAYPCDAALPNASVANFQAFVTKASQTVVSLSAAGQVCLNTSAQTNLIADAVGYFDASSDYVTLAPARLLETRVGPTYETVDGLFEGSNILAGGTTVQLTVSGRGNVPAGDQTVVLNVTAISSPGSGFVTAYPCGVQRPDVSVLNMVPGTTVNNHLVVDTGTDGKVCVYVSTGTHLLVDVEGVLP